MDAGPAGAPAVPDPPGARRKGHAAARRELLEHWWDVNFDGGPAAVEVLVHRLRRKVGAAGRPPVIETLRGADYIIRDDE